VSVGKVWLVGAGPGDPGLLTLKAARALAQCDVLVYDYLASAAIVAMAAPGCDRIYVGKKAGAHTMSQDEITALIVRLGLEGKRVVRLKGGDVFIFARGGEEAAELRAAGVPFEIVPGITSAIAAPAYAGIPVTHRDHNTSLTIATGHEDPTKGYSSLDYAKLANPKQTLVFLMAMGSLAGIVSKLREHGMPGDQPVGIVREGTKPTQQTLVGTLDTIVADVERTKFAAPAIVVIGQVVRERETIRWFDDGPLFGKRVLVTRPLAGAADFANELWGAGAEPLIAPTIEIASPDDPAPAIAAIAALDSYDWIVFSSRNGVDAAFTLLAKTGGDARRFGRAKVAAVGSKTATALRERGIIADLVPETFSAASTGTDLAGRIRARDRVLCFGAEESSDALPEALVPTGATVDFVAGYRTAIIRDPSVAEAASKADVWAFASGSAVLGLLANVPDAIALSHGKTVACIGPATADAARAAGLRVDVIADEATVVGLVSALAMPLTA